MLAAAAALAALAVPLWTAAEAGASKSTDQKIAETGMLEPEDLPATWTQGLRDPNSDKTTDYAAKRISECKQYVEFRKEVRSLKHARAFSIGYSQGQNNLANTVNVIQGPNDAKAMMAR